MRSGQDGIEAVKTGEIDMATIIKDIALATPADKAWAMLREVGAADKAFPGVLAACCVDGDVRTVTFANGLVVRERIVTVDDQTRRLAYGVIEGRFSHHSASMQVRATGEGTCRMIWVSDFLPNEAAEVVAPLVDQGALALQNAARIDP